MADMATHLQTRFRVWPYVVVICIRVTWGKFGLQWWQFILFMNRTNVVVMLEQYAVLRDWY